MQFGPRGKEETTVNMSEEAHPRRRAYGEDLRRLAVAAVLEEGMNLAAAGRRFGVSGVIPAVEV